MTKAETERSSRIVQLSGGTAWTEHSSERDLLAALERPPRAWKIHETQSAEAELARLLELFSFLDVLETNDGGGDTGKDKTLDAITETVRAALDASWACVSLVDLDRQSFASLAEAENSEPLAIPNGTARRDSFCQHAILQKELMVVRDASKDERFRDSEHVRGEPGFRFYAAVPLVTPSGYSIGTLCVLDPRERPEGINAEQEKLLKVEAEHVMQILSARRDEQQTIRKRSSSNDLTKDHVDALKAEQETSKVSEMTGQGSEFSLVEQSDSEKHNLVEAENEAVAVGKRSRASSPSPEQDTRCNRLAALQPILPSPQDANMDPDEYLACLVEALWPGLKLKVKPATQLPNYFLHINEDQMARYSKEVVNIARNNDVDGLRKVLEEHGRDALDCFNRFGEGLLNIACRRGFKEMVHFLLSEPVNLDVRISDDFGRSPLHDTCWNPEPQLEISAWIMQKDPSLFLVADKRGYSPFQYARPSDYAIWRQFLFDHRHYLLALTEPEIADKFS